MTARMALGLLMGISLVGCGAQTPQSNQDSQVKIVGGKNLRSNHRLAKSTVALVTNNEEGHPQFCSGTLVTDTLVVTAAHCLENVDAKTISVFFGSKVPDGKEVKVKSAVRITGASFPSRDIGYVTLEDKAPKEAEPVRVWLADDPAKEFSDGLELTLAGFGMAGEDKDGSEGIRRYVEMFVREFINRDSVDAGQNLIVLKANPGKNACYGDSGGPAYMKKNDEWFLVGATNGKTPQISGTESHKCDSDGTIYTYVGGYLEWMEKDSGIDIPTNKDTPSAPIVAR